MHMITKYNFLHHWVTINTIKITNLQSELEALELTISHIILYN